MRPEDLKAIQASIKEAQKALEEAKKDLEDARRAGIDVTEQAEQIRDLERKIARLVAVYGEKK
jgi:predicted  nucleic acid-binding Zn-ribbon protein